MANVSVYNMEGKEVGNSQFLTCDLGDVDAREGCVPVELKFSEIG